MTSSRTPAPMLARGTAGRRNLVKVNAFGNALGSSLAEASQPETQGVGPYSSADYRNGSDIESDNAYYDRVTQQALSSAGPGLSDSATDAEVMAYRMREAGFGGEMTPTGARLQLSPGSTDDPRVLELQSRIARLSAISNEARALGASMDSAITDRLNRESVIRETVSPLDGEVSGPGLRVSESLASRFADGVLGAVKGVTVEPLLQVHDLGLALGSVAYNELFRSEGDALWLPEMKSGMADAYANGASQTRLMLQATPFTAPGVASYDLTTAAMNGDWGGVAEGVGSLAGGLAIGKGVSKYGGYGLTFDDIGATGPMASQMGAIRPRFVSPEVTPRDFNLLVNERNGILSTLSKEGIVDFKINAVGSPMRGAEMFDKMMQSYGDDVAGVRGNWMNRDADASNKNLGVVNKLTAQGLPLEEAVLQTWTAQQASRYGYTVPVVQMDRVVGQPGNYSKVETIFYREDK